MNYRLTNLEEDIQKLYLSLSICSPFEIDMKDISDKLGIDLIFEDVGSQTLRSKSKYYIFINEKLPIQNQWQDFGHELGHWFKHVGDQKGAYINFRNLQEWQADNFMYHFCIPTFMLLNLNICNYSNIEDGVPFVSKTFNVTEDFARERLQMFQRQMFQAKSDEEHRKFMESLYPKAPPYSDETNKVLKQLELLKAKKKQKVVD